MKKRTQWLLLIVPLLAATGWGLTPAALRHTPAAGDRGSLPLLATETEPGLVEGTEKRIVWFEPHTKTRWAVVALHGFSASRQETAPLAETVARQLGANLFEARLTGHGLQRNPLTGVQAEDWLNDAAEAIAIGTQLGDRVILIGTSTGATLAVAMLDSALMAPVDSLVFLSPNFAPKDTRAQWLTRPAGPLLARLMIGEMRSWTPHNDAQALYWSTRYPTAATVEMMRLVDHANTNLPTRISQRVQVFYSRDDQVVSVPHILDAFAMIDSPQKELVQVDNPGDPSKHVLAGDVLSPDRTVNIANSIVQFVLTEDSP